MKWSKDFVWSKIDIVAPTARMSGLSLPEALKAAAVNCFMYEDSLSYSSLVVRVCLQELKEMGELSFGNVEEDWM